MEPKLSEMEGSGQFLMAIDAERFHFQQNVREEIRAELGIQDKFAIGHVGRFWIHEESYVSGGYFCQSMQRTG